MAQQFQQAVEASLKANANTALARAKIEQIKDVPGGFSDENRAAFLMIATVSSSRPPMATKREAH
jgi:hypothetical protein